MAEQPAKEQPVKEEPDDGLEAAEAEDEKDFQTQLKYLAAEFDNFRKRAAKEKKDASQSAVEKMVAELLPVLDDLDAAVAALETHGADKKTVDGVEMVRKKLLKILETKGLKRMEAAGKKFDVALHDAAGFEESGLEEGTITKEVQAGYMVGATVVRHAKVMLAKGPAKSEKQENASK
ncbi:MAG: nucleotide exchange factor GrpE [Candidatus Micrarchaeota archaeon]